MFELQGHYCYADDKAPLAHQYRLGYQRQKLANPDTSHASVNHAFPHQSISCLLYTSILERGGVNDIYAVASHGLFAGGAGEVLNASPIKEILVTDSVATKENVPTSVKYLSASELIANAITRIFERQPLSPLFAYTANEE